MSIKRYCFDPHGMYESEHGQWVMRADHKSQLAALKEEVKILTAENELLEDRVSELEAREIDAIANKICEHLPKDYEIRLCMEKDSGWVELHCPDSDNDRHDFECSIYSQLLCALEVAEDLSKEPANEG